MFLHSWMLFLLWQGLGAAAQVIEPTRLAPSTLSSSGQGAPVAGEDPELWSLCLHPDFTEGFHVLSSFPQEHQLVVVGGWVATTLRSSCLALCTCGLAT